MPLKEIDLVYRTMFAELGQRTFDAAFESEFPPGGRFVPVTVKNRQYWYFDTPTGGGKQKRQYVGPMDDPEIARRVEDFQALKDDLKSRRRLVSTLTREAGLIAPEKLSGDIVEAMSNAGLFRLRAILVGTIAFQTYAGVLGVRLPSSSMQTGDADFAQDYAVSAEVNDSLPPVLDLLQSVDPSFRPVPHRSGSPKVTAFQNRNQYRVEFLTTNRGSDDYEDRPADMPALGGAAADPMRFMDFLIYDPIRTVMLHKSGVNASVPAPARYAIHKLIVASRRQNDGVGYLKREKDVRQAMLLLEAMMLTRQGGDLEDALREAWGRGRAWQEGILKGLAMVPDKKADYLSALIEVMKELGAEPENFR